MKGPKDIGEAVYHKFFYDNLVMLVRSVMWHSVTWQNVPTALN